MTQAALSKKSSFDLSYSRAATILTRQPEQAPITIILVGCGGTGSHMAPKIGRLLYALKDKGVMARALFYDFDYVEPQNIGRQLFCQAEIGMNKAECLALRYGTGWGISIAAMPARFEHKFIQPQGDELTIIVGCVDNAHGRKEMAKTLTYNNHNGPHGPDCRCDKRNTLPYVWWLDCGNHEDAGQVLLGSADSGRILKRAFPSKTICRSLPSPALQQPDLLKAARGERSTKKMSCAELAALNMQSLNINDRIAGEASNMLTSLVLTRNLKYFATHIHLPSGATRPTYVTPENLEVYTQ